MTLMTIDHDWFVIMNDDDEHGRGWINWLIDDDDHNACRNLYGLV